MPGASDGNADFQFSMLKASLDYDTEIFGSNVSQHVIENNPLSRNISTLSEATSNGETPPGAKRKSKKQNQNCNAPGAMRAYAQYTQVCSTLVLNYGDGFIPQEGGFVPECIRRPEIGLDLEIFNSNAVSDIQERMANFNELNFYDGTLNTNLSLEEAHAKVELMRDEVVKKADKVRNLPGSSYSGGSASSGGGGSSMSLMEKRKMARKKKSRRASSISTIKA